ncbi:MAG: fused MFS/spermidine synthase [Myxococcales bacterium]|nr:fused MFS/spermidine synthase [Myxococcales bacterium]
MALYPLTIFLSAFLLFQVQPLIAKHILPWYGGGPGVWTACMLFFQVFLLIGYAYAHGINRLRAGRQAAVHLGALGLSLAFVSIAPTPEWQPTGSEAPTLHILLLLSVHVGVPFATLAATSPLVTRWFSRVWPDRPPYRLYALSNAGSLLALLSYPFVVEPTLTLGMQETLWSAGYVAFVVLCGVVSLTFLRRAPALGGLEQRADDGARPHATVRRSDTVLWLALAATGSVLLLATTNQVCQDLTVVPMLWILPLAIYLLSFIICFDRESWYRRGFFFPLYAVFASAAVWVLHSGEAGWIQIGIFALTLFVGTMVCHGELVRAKPAPEYLTRFYLAVSAGGALGGLVVGILAPRLFLGYWEYPLGLLAAGVLAMICARRNSGPILGGPPRRQAAWAGALFILAGVAVGSVSYERSELTDAIETTRTFFGITRVENRRIPAGDMLVMRHGRIAHGSQFLLDPLRREPTSYFGRTSGVGVAIRRYRILLDEPNRGLRVGIVGLGAGTLAVYGRAEDFFRFYEIDPEVERVARNYFAYLHDSPAEIEIVLGDARLMLERAEEGSNFDLLILDAFSGDAVPVHLLTREAYQIYLSHIRPGGLLVFQVSNRYLDLGAVVRGLAEEAGQETVSITTTGDLYVDTKRASYVIATDNQAFLADPTLKILADASPPEKSAPLIWTDSFASLMTAMTSRLPSQDWESAPNRGHFVVDRGDLLSVEDEVRVKAMSQGLYTQTGGKAAMVVVTAPSLPAEAAGEASLAQYLTSLFQKLGLTDSEISDGLLVFVAREHLEAAVLVTPSWPSELREQIDWVFENQTLQAFSEGNPSRGIAELVERFDQLARIRNSAK